ncbi:MAG: DUF4143 domain-containing protein [Verrucomicrobiales bacterium]|nr:DUF4143 domain-containing protein [Verrucomicrobiales bacterium]
MTAENLKTSAGAEIDLVLDLPGGQKWAVEIKRSLAPKVSRGFYSAIEDLHPQKAFVIHAGEDEYPISQQVTAIPLTKIVTQLLELPR